MLIKEALLRGGGTQNSPWYIQGLRNEAFTSMSIGFKICDREGISQLSIAYSGRYYVCRDNEWYETSDSDVCDKAYGLLAEGRKVRGRPVGFSPINGNDGAMTKKNKAWSMPSNDWEWLESQPNQSEIIRNAIAFYRQNR